MIIHYAITYDICISLLVRSVERYGDNNVYFKEHLISNCMSSFLFLFYFFLNDVSPSTDVIPEPEMRGLGNGSFIAKQQNVTCHVSYHLSENVTFDRELIGEHGLQLSPPGYLGSVIYHKNNTATFAWVLNYTPDHDYCGYKLRCVLLVDNAIHGNYIVEDEVYIQVCGMFIYR